MLFGPSSLPLGRQFSVQNTFRLEPKLDAVGPNFPIDMSWEHFITLVVLVRNSQKNVFREMLPIEGRTSNLQMLNSLKLLRHPVCYRKSKWNHEGSLLLVIVITIVPMLTKIWQPSCPPWATCTSFHPKSCQWVRFLFLVFLSTAFVVRQCEVERVGVW